jgi:mercuric ion transport protein
MKPITPETTSITAGFASAVGASACCVLPLTLVSVGLGGAWVSQLRAMERFAPVFIGLALIAFGYAFYRLYLKPAPCAPATECAIPAARRRQRVAFWGTLITAKLLIVFPIFYASLVV